MEAKTKKYLMYAGIAVAVIVVIAMFVIPALQKKKETKDILDQSEEISANDQQQNTSGFNPKPYNDRIDSDLQSYFGDTELYKELITRTDDDLRTLWKDWEVRKKAANKNKHLGAAIYDGYYWSRFMGATEWTESAAPFYNKLKAIGLP